MKKSRYNDERTVRFFREADHDPISEVAKRHGVSEASRTFDQRIKSLM